MIYALILAGLAIVYLAFQVHRLLAHHAEERSTVLEQFERLVHADRKERQLLLNRIQAPDVAVAQALEPPEQPVKSYVDPELDDEHWDAIKELANGGS